jgi:hypothetical protein
MRRLGEIAHFVRIVNALQQRLAGLQVGELAIVVCLGRCRVVIAAADIWRAIWHADHIPQPNLRASCHFHDEPIAKVTIYN